MKGPIMRVVELTALDWARKDEAGQPAEHPRDPHEWFLQRRVGRMASYQSRMVEILEEEVERVERGAWSSGDFEELDDACRIWNWTGLQVWEWPLSPLKPALARPNRDDDETFEEGRPFFLQSLGHASTSRHQLGRRVAAMHGMDRTDFASRAAEEVVGW
ncbi:hypothetical protein JCM8547_009206 [Rhodosporidiobolus lusitaniae]